MILVNKWDLVEKDTQATKLFTEAIQEEIAPFVDVPIVFISSLTKQRVFKAIETAVDVYKKRSKANSNTRAQRFYASHHSKNSTSSDKGKYVKIKFCLVTQ